MGFIYRGDYVKSWLANAGHFQKEITYFTCILINNYIYGPIPSYQLPYNNLFKIL